MKKTKMTRANPLSGDELFYRAICKWNREKSFKNFKELYRQGFTPSIKDVFGWRIYRIIRNTLTGRYQELEVELGKKVKATDKVTPFEGEWIQLPCKVGTPIYWVTNYITDRQVRDLCVTYNEETDCGVVKLTVDGFYYDLIKGWCFTIQEIPYHTIFFIEVEDIGNNVFYDPVVAELKLKEKVSENGNV